MIRFLMPLLSGVLVAGLASAAPMTIDNFTMSQGPVSSSFGSTVTDEVTNDGSFVGAAGVSKRTLYVNGTGEPPPSLNVSAIEIGNQELAVNSSEKSVTWFALKYHDLDLDLSRHYGFTFHDLEFDHTAFYNVIVRDAIGGESNAFGTFSLPMGVKSDVLLSFSSFLGDADWSLIDQLVFSAWSNEGGFDLNMTQISAAIPIPAAGFFLVTALAGLGLLRSRRMAEAA